jgi:hypothetical protein
LQARISLAVADAFPLDPPILVRVIHIVMGEVDETSLVVPDVLTVNDHVVSHREGHALADLDVVGHEHGLRGTGQSDDETLMRTRRSGVIGEKPRDRALRGDLDLGAVLRERALDR